MHDTYRRCAAIAVLRDGPCGTREVLLLHKPRKNDAWQLPQGGIEQGETVEQAAARELFEEAGITVEIHGKGTHTYTYDFPSSFRSYRPDSICGQTVDFVVATAKADTEVQVDNNEIDDYMWVEVQNLQKFLRRKKYLQKVYDVLTEAKKMYGV